MTTVAPFDAVVRGQAAGFWHDLLAMAARALRQMRREPVSFLPAVFIPAFFYVVNLGALGSVADKGGLDYKAFLLPMAIAFVVTGVSRAPTLVTDIPAAIQKYGIAADWTVESLAYYTQAVIQGAFILAKAQQSSQVAAACLDHLRRYLEFLFTCSGPVALPQTPFAS